MKDFVEDGLHPRIIIKGIREALKIALSTIKDIAISSDDSTFRSLLEKCAGTALNSKLIARQKHIFAPMIVDAVTSLDEPIYDLKLIGIKKVTGGSVTESSLIKGVAFKKTFSYAGFEQQPKHLQNPKILLLNVELELKSEKENAEIRISDPDQYQSIVDAEWQIIYEKLEQCVISGAKIILSRLPIGDLATQYFADRNIFCAGRVASDDLDRVAKATGATVQSTVFGITEKVLGECEVFEERGVGDERYNFFTGCPKAKTATILLRGGGEQFLEETDRSVWDALNIVKRTLQSRHVVAGGGAIEMEIAQHLKTHALTIEGKIQLIVLAVARAMEIIPRQLAENAGLDSTDILNKLRRDHASLNQPEGRWMGVDVLQDASVFLSGATSSNSHSSQIGENQTGVTDTLIRGVWEPASNKSNALAAAAEAACVILSIDETVRNPQSEKPGAPSQGVGLGAGGGGGGGGGAQSRRMVSEAMGGKGMAGMMGNRGVNHFKGKGGA
jgi:T-complex protein 1 subunit eta